MKTLLFVVPIVFGIAAFGTNHILAEAENKEAVPIVEEVQP